MGSHFPLRYSFGLRACKARPALQAVTIASAVLLTLQSEAQAGPFGIFGGGRGSTCSGTGCQVNPSGGGSTCANGQCFSQPQPNGRQGSHGYIQQVDPSEDNPFASSNMEPGADKTRGAGQVINTGSNCANGFCNLGSAGSSCSNGVCNVGSGTCSSGNCGGRSGGGGLFGGRGGGGLFGGGRGLFRGRGGQGGGGLFSGGFLQRLRGRL